MVDNLVTLLKESPGNTDVLFFIRDGEGIFKTRLKSRSVKISVQNKLISYIKSQEGIDYKFN